MKLFIGLEFARRLVLWFTYGIKTNIVMNYFIAKVFPWPETVRIHCRLAPSKDGMNFAKEIL